MDMQTIDTVRLNFSPQTMFWLKACMGLMIFGVALDLKWDDFKRVFSSPKAPVIGLVAQFILLPAFTFLLTMVARPTPSIALGMMLVAACPGGNLSNIVTHLAKGNVALSISMTAVSSAAALIMTPLNLSIWGNLNPDTAPIMRAVMLSPFDVFVDVLVLLGIPSLLGALFAKRYPNLTKKLYRPFRVFSVLVMCCFVGGALKANWDIFRSIIHAVLGLVFLHNLVALNIGYWFSRMLGLAPRDVRAVTIEVGCQNSGLGLVLVFSFFNGLGGMAVVTAWWGVWHIISGLLIGNLWPRLLPAQSIPQLRSDLTSDPSTKNG